MGVGIEDTSDNTQISIGTGSFDFKPNDYYICKVAGVKKINGSQIYSKWKTVKVRVK